LTIRNLKRK